MNGNNSVLLDSTTRGESAGDHCHKVGDIRRSLKHVVCRSYSTVHWPIKSRDYVGRWVVLYDQLGGTRRGLRREEDEMHAAAVTSSDPHGTNRTAPPISDSTIAAGSCWPGARCFVLRRPRVSGR